MCRAVTKSLKTFPGCETEGISTMNPVPAGTMFPEASAAYTKTTDLRTASMFISVKDAVGRRRAITKQIPRTLVRKMPSVTIAQLYLPVPKIGYRAILSTMSNVHHVPILHNVVF